MFVPVPPVKVAVVDECEIDAAGLATVLGAFPDRVQVVAGDVPDLDAILYGLHELDLGHDERLHALLRSTSTPVIALGWSADPLAIAMALSCGADGHLSKTSCASELVTGIEQVLAARGARPRLLPEDGHCHPDLDTTSLTPREVDVLALVSQGLSNEEIAEALFLSINSIKSYIRIAYRKIGVTRRSQAVAWGLQRGLDHHTARLPEPGTPTLAGAAGP